MTNVNREKFDRDWTGKVIHGEPDSSQSTLIRTGTDVTVMKCYRGEEGRKVTANVDINGETLNGRICIHTEQSRPTHRLS